MSIYLFLFKYKAGDAQSAKQRHEAAGTGESDCTLRRTAHNLSGLWSLRPNFNALLSSGSRCRDAAVGNDVNDDWLANRRPFPTIDRTQTALGEKKKSTTLAAFSLKLESSARLDPLRVCVLRSVNLYNVCRSYTKTRFHRGRQSAHGCEILHWPSGAFHSAAQGGK